MSNELVEYGDIGDLELPPHLAELLEGEAQVEVLVDLGVAIAAGTGGVLVFNAVADKVEYFDEQPWAGIAIEAVVGLGAGYFLTQAESSRMRSAGTGLAAAMVGDAALKALTLLLDDEDEDEEAEEEPESTSAVEIFRQPRASASGASDGGESSADQRIRQVLHQQSPVPTNPYAAALARQQQRGRY